MVICKVLKRSRIWVSENEQVGIQFFQSNRIVHVNKLNLTETFWWLIIRLLQRKIFLFSELIKIIQRILVSSELLFSKVRNFTPVVFVVFKYWVNFFESGWILLCLKFPKILKSLDHSAFSDFFNQFTFFYWTLSHNGFLNLLKRFYVFIVFFVLKNVVKLLDSTLNYFFSTEF